jgi:argininosuccinate synthase
VASTQRHVTGTVKMKLFKGSARVAGRASPHSLYDEGLATFGADDVYTQSDAAGFIRLYGLAVRTQAERERRLGARLAEAAD